MARIAAGPSDGLQDLLLGGAAQVQSPLQQEVLSFYLQRGFSFAWVDAAEIEVVRKLLARAADQGLRPLDYSAHGELGTAEFDMALTTALLRYARDIRFGRTRPAIYKDARLPAQNFDFALALNHALERGSLTSFLNALSPNQPQYQLLIAALNLYRATAARGGWPIVKTEEQLAARLSAEDPALASQPAPTQQDVRAALIRYQQRNGLTADGKLGADTLRELNIPVTVRIGQIMANLDRWRWMPAEVERWRVEVNVPDQSLNLMDGDNIVLHSRVIIGKKTTPTPLLRTAAVSVIANPPWDIPDDIAARQLLTHLKRDANYLAQRHLSLIGAPPDVAVDWRKVSGSHLPYQIRQPPGPDNALGRLMLDMPNPFDVYMHDTPNKALFRGAQREASNGCIRVELIERLAGLVLGDDDALDDALAGRETRTLALRQPLPVYLLYWTAIAQDDGTVGFRPDRYQRDKLLLARLNGP